MATVTQTKISVGATTTAIVAANQQRTQVIIVNDSDEDVYLKIGASAVMNEGILVAPNGSFSMEETIDNPVLKTAINGICSSGSKNVTVFER